MILSLDTLFCIKCKVQLIKQISAGLVAIDLTEKNCPAITSNYHCPTELKDGKKHFIQTWVEADNIIIQKGKHMS